MRHLLKGTWLLLAWALVAMACGGREGSAPTTTTAPAPPLSPATPDLDDPLLLGDTAVEALCVSLAAAVAGGDDPAMESLARALAAAVRESEAGTAEQRTAVADTLLTDPSPPGFALAAGLLVDGMGLVGCQELSEEIAVEDTPRFDPEVVAAQLAAARQRWGESGIGDGDYTLVMFAEHSDWFEQPVSDNSEEDCGLFGEWRVLISRGEVVEARDRFSGCLIDLDDGLFWPIPKTVDQMFAFIEANIEMIEGFEPHPVTGVPNAVDVDLSDGYLFFGVQEVTAGHPIGPGEVLAELERQRLVWKAQMAYDYTLITRLLCFCPSEVTGWYEVEVQGGEVIRITSGDPIGSDIGEDDLPEFVSRTVEDLFAAVEAAAFADSLKVIYHETLGYPVSIDVDPVRNAVDEEYQIEAVVLVD